ncbi:TPA: hypothetical protein ACGUEB_004445, partial [Salmonella enterica]
INYLTYQHILPHGGSGISVPGGQILHHGNEKPGNPLLPLSVAIADEENAMADIAKTSASNTLLNLFIISPR